MSGADTPITINNVNLERNSEFYISNEAWAEQQTLSVIGDPTGGSISLDLGGHNTAAINFDPADPNVTAANIQNGLAALPGLNEPPFVGPIDDSVDEVQRIHVTGNPTSGTFQLDLGGVSSGVIDYSNDIWSTASAIDTALESLYPNGVYVSGSDNSRDEMQRIRVSGTPLEGGLTLSFNGAETDPMNPIDFSGYVYDIAADMQSQLANLPGSGLSGASMCGAILLVV